MTPFETLPSQSTRKQYPYTQTTIPTGAIFGRLRVIGSLDRQPYYTQQGKWRARYIYPCVCICGALRDVDASNLLYGTVKSCGCYQRELHAISNAKHGDRRPGRITTLYTIWRRIWAECRNPKRLFYASYGGRGISVDPTWEDYSIFREWALASGYQEGLHLCRDDQHADFSPANCRWGTKKASPLHERLLTAFGDTKNMTAWLKDPRCLVNAQTLSSRLRRGWTVEQALTQPLERSNVLTAWGEAKSITEWTADARCVVTAGCLRQRIANGWEVERALTTPTGRGPAPRLLTAFGETKHLSAWVHDDRCVVELTTLHFRLNKGWELERALTIPAGGSDTPRGRKKRE